jgi:hypothetical protein
MRSTKINLLAFLSFFLSLSFPNQAGAALIPPPASAQETASHPAGNRVIGSIKTISGGTITLTPATGADVSVTVDSTTRIVRIAPGEKSLKNATPLQLQDLQTGDHILVGGKASDDGKSISASSVVVMKLADVEAKQEKERQDWQKRGMGGVVSSVDAATGTVTISITGFGATKSIAVKTSPTTIFRRYAPDSVKFDDAKPSSLQEIHPGDQLRARGDRSADGSEVTAEEIVAGSFRNIAGVINSVDASSGVITVQDLLSKKSVQIKVTTDSQVHKLPAEMAQRIAMRLKGSAAGAGSASNPAAGNPSAASAGSAQAAQTAGAGVGAPGTGGSGGMSGGMRQGASDFNQMLAHMPAATIADLNKGDAVLIVATEGSANTTSTAITLVSGVEPILRAAPSASQAMMLSPWSLGGPSGDSQ